MRIAAITLRSGPRGGTYRTQDGWKIQRGDHWVQLERGETAFEVPREKVEWVDLREPRARAAQAMQDAGLVTPAEAEELAKPSPKLTKKAPTKRKRRKPKGGEGAKKPAQ